MEQDLESRIDRQNRIEGWNPKALARSTVTLICSGPLSHFVATGLTGLQPGKIRIVDNRRFDGVNGYEFLYLDNPTPNGEEKVYSLSRILEKMNSRIKVQPVHSMFVGPLGRGSTVIVDLTNDPNSKNRSMNYAIREKIPYISASTDFTRGTVTSMNPSDSLEGTLAAGHNPREDDFLNLHYDGRLQGIVTSGIIGGIVVEEIRRAIFALRDDDLMLRRAITYNLASATRFRQSDDYPILGLEGNKNIRVAVIGAGALGNFVGINLALLGYSNITFIDYDVISSSNLNRQPCFTFYDCVGMKKVYVITDILHKINPRITVEGLDGKIVGSQEEKEEGVNPISIDYLSQFDLVMCCVDNRDTRVRLSNYISNLFKRDNKSIPIVDGASGHDSGNVAVYVPGSNACIDCQLGYSGMPKGVKDSCPSDQHDPSVVYTNMIIASLMSGEALLLMKGGQQRAIENPIFYDSYEPKRFGIKKGRLNRCELCR